MAKWDNINGIIENAIKSNNAQSITGDSLQSVLKSIVSDVGANATFAGIAIASTSPGSYDGPVFYIAASAGTYAGFGSIVVNAGELAVLYNSANGNGWSKSSIGLSSIVDKSITKAKLASDVPIDAMQNKITQLETSVNTVVGEGATEAIENFAEILAFLNGITDTTTLEGLLTNLKTEIDSKLSNKVDKVSGKGLSTNDYTTAEKDKLNSIEAGAQKNTVTGIKGNTESSYRTGNVNLTSANIGAAAASHTHAISEVTDLQTTLSGKAASSHVHSASDITSGTLPVERIADGSITTDKIADGSITDSKLASGFDFLSEINSNGLYVCAGIHMWNKNTSGYYDAINVDDIPVINVNIFKLFVIYQVYDSSSEMATSARVSIHIGTQQHILKYFYSTYKTHKTLFVAAMRKANETEWTFIDESVG